MNARKSPSPPPGADPLLWTTLQHVAARLRGAEDEALTAAADAKARGMRADHIAMALGWSRATLYRRMADRW